MTPTDTQSIEQWLESNEDDLVAVRRHLHANPEPSGEEYETTRFLAGRLEAAGLRPRTLACGTGLVCDIGEGSGPTVALRADIDALHMNDEKDVPYRSRTAGVAHACGHDVHTAVVLGTGLHLLRLGDRLGGRVRLIFQPAEERVPGGALDVIADRGLDGVDAVLGLHCNPQLDVGTIGLRAGAITAAADMAEVVLTGPGGHTARPEETVDLVTVAARLVDELPGRVGSELDEPGPFKLVFGSIHAGDASNVIPTRAVLQASVRTRSIDTWLALPAAFDRAVSAFGDETGAGVVGNYTHGVPPVDNDEEITSLVRRTSVAALSEHAVTEAPSSWGGDDFAWYLRERPGTYIRLGTHDPRSGQDHRDLHVGHFDVDERAIGVGVRVLSAAALGFLHERAPSLHRTPDSEAH